MKIILFANTDWYLFNFRLNLALALKDRGDEVVLLSPPGEYVARLESKGFRWVSLPLSRRGMNPITEIRTILQLARFYNNEKPEVVHHFTIKCVLYGTLAARLMGIRNIVNSITGLGYIFLPGGLFKSILRFLVKGWYRLLLRGTKVIFENDEDRQTFLRFRFIRSTQAHLIPGVGIDMEHFVPTPLPNEIPVILLAARLLWDKGVGEFVEAARQLRAEEIRARFALAGRIDLGNPNSITESQIESWRDEGIIEWWGWIEDLSKAMAQTSIFCLPSYYREGLPTVLMEASACGRPVVTTDWPGCRDAIQDGISGLLVQPKDAVSLISALKKLIDNPILCRKMGGAGRNFVEEKYSSKRIIREIILVYNNENGSFRNDK